MCEFFGSPSFKVKQATRASACGDAAQHKGPHRLNTPSGPTPLYSRPYGLSPRRMESRFFQEIQHDAVELIRLLHMRVMSRPGNDNLLRASDTLLQYAGGLNDLWRILVADHNQCRYPDLREPVDRRRFEWNHVLFVSHKVAMPLYVLL